MFTGLCILTVAAHIRGGNTPGKLISVALCMSIVFLAAAMLCSHCHNTVFLVHWTGVAAGMHRFRHPGLAHLVLIFSEGQYRKSKAGEMCFSYVPNCVT